MTKQEFNLALEIMVDSLPTVKPANRVNSLFHFFGDKEKELIVATVQECARTLDRFPTPKQFGDIMSKVKPNVSKKTYLNRFGCDKCKNTGLIHATHIDNGCGYVFSCNCEMAARYSSYPSWFGPDRAKFKRDTYDAQDLMNSPRDLKKILEKLNKDMTMFPHSLRERIAIQTEGHPDENVSI